MAQYYQVTSLEELHRLYPNLQLDNIEGIPCMIQDDQVTQYTDGQGQQVIATVEQSGMQLTQNQNVQQQCQPQSQFIVHQPTQYVIQQMDTNKPQAPAVQYIQQRPQIPQKQEEVSEAQFKDQNMACAAADMGSEEPSMQQCILKPESGPQFIPQVQPILHQPIQIHQQIGALDMGPNILVLQNQEQQDLILNQNKRQDLISNQSSPDKHQLPHQQQQQQQHIIIQRHQPSKTQQTIHQRAQTVQKEEQPPQQFVSQQVVQNRRPSQGGGQQQQIIHQPPQQIIQQLHYYNQVTVVDNFSQPNVTIEHPTSLNENLGQQQQAQPIQTQVQQPINQCKPKKNVQQMGISTIVQQPQQVIIPQRFEMSSPPPLASRNPQPKKKGNQHEVETSSAPVFIVQKLDSPFVIRQPQNKRQGQNSSSDKRSEGSFQSVPTQRELNSENVQTNQQVVHSQTRAVSQIDTQQQTSNVPGVPAQSTKFSPDRNPNCGQVKTGAVEQPFGNRATEQMNKSKIVPSVAKSPAVKIKTTEQQTDPTSGSDVKETGSHQFERFMGNMQGQPQVVPTSTQIQPATQTPPTTQIQNQIQLSGRGRGLRGAHVMQLPRGGHQYVARARGVQVQTSPPRLPNAEEAGASRRLLSPRGGGRGGRGGWVPCGPDQRPPSARAGGTQISQPGNPKAETSQVPNESPEEARMVVLLLNGEKKVRIPCSQQNILLNQILQQAGLQFTSPTSLAIEQVTDSNTEQYIIKNNPTNNQQQPSTHKASSVTHTVAIPNSVVTPRSIVATIHQQRPRGQSPHLPQGSTVGIIRHRLHFASPRISSPGSSVPQGVASQILVTEAGTPLAHTTQNSTPTLHPPKEEPRFVKGFMAICPFCGISSLDFNKCIRCRRKLPENVKSQSIFNAKKKKSEKAIIGAEKTSDECKSETDEKQSDLSSNEGKDKPGFQGYDKKKLKPCLKKKKINDEPAEILILSSDEEEEETQSKKTSVNQQPLTLLRKEPVYAENEVSEAEINDLNNESNLIEDLMKNVQPGFFTTLQCRTIRIGSYKVQPKERVFISSKGIRLVINSLKNENTVIVISMTNIVKALVHFGKQIPIIFLYPLPKVGLQIRNALGMEDKAGPYYDPASSQEETHKRFTLLLEKITEDNKIALNKIFGQLGKLEELTEKEANDILIRASPTELQNSGLSKTSDSIRKIMVYPPPPEKGGITLNNQDYACLGEDQFLNDVIIDFYLKYLLLKVLSPEDRNRTHVFSTFFYKRLTTKPKTMRKNDPENDPKLSPAEKRHMRVKGWTKQVNLFEKDFIIVPINEHSHWFLAIICFPRLTGPVKFADNSPVDLEEVVPKKNTQSVQIGNTTITQIIKPDGNSISLEMDSASDRDEAEGDQDDLHPSSDEEESEQAEEDAAPPTVQIPLLTPVPQQQASVKETKTKPVKRKIVKEPIKQPCILIFDSLAGASRVRVVATLRDYLKIEYKKKMGQERDFSKDTIKGAVPKVPQQNNFTDCGLYVLQYVESFFQDPLPDFKLPLKYLQDWFPEEVVSCKRQKLACLIRTLMEEQGLKVEEMGLPVLTFNSGSNPGDDQCRMEEDEEEEDEDEMNEEEEELLRRRIHISEYDNEEDEDMDLGEEEEDEEDDEDLDDDIDDDGEELEVGEIPRQWFARARGSCNELESSVKHVGGHVLIKTSALVDYEPSDSDEEEGQILSQNSEMTNTDPTSIANEMTEEEEYREAERPLSSSENRKNVPLTELQDFESQISCTTIERNFDGKNSESDMGVSEDEEEEEESCAGAADEETSFEASKSAKVETASDNHNQSLERRHFQTNEVLVKDNKGIEVSNILQKLVNDKSITISRKEEDLDSSLFKKQLDAKRFKLKDFNKSEESKKLANNLATCKRSFQALKSVRIPKKAERKLELSNKRQKLDER